MSTDDQARATPGAAAARATPATPATPAAPATSEKALEPEDLTRLFVERANKGDAAGLAALYEEDAVMAYPPGGLTVGREAIRALWEKILSASPHFEQESPLPTLISGDIALTSTAPKDGAGARAQVVRRQPDGSWLRLLDQPEFESPASP
jgi:ketosteroid isomerase-like protein